VDDGAIASRSEVHHLAHRCSIFVPGPMMAPGLICPGSRASSRKVQTFGPL
jgi:hypothetical protein